jgi:hypothetical protein
MQDYPLSRGKNRQEGIKMTDIIFANYPNEESGTKLITTMVPNVDSWIHENRKRRDRIQFRLVSVTVSRKLFKGVTEVP